MPRLLPASLSETELPLVFCKKIIRTAIPHGNLIENNVYVQVGKIIDGKKEWLNFKSNNWETNDDPGFADWKNANFSLKSHLHIFREIPSFKEIPFQEIGLYDNPDFATNKKTNGLRETSISERIVIIPFE